MLTVTKFELLDELGGHRIVKLASGSQCLIDTEQAVVLGPFGRDIKFNNETEIVVGQRIVKINPGVNDGH